MKLADCSCDDFPAVIESGKLEIISNIPQASGLGSSAALSVALARALRHTEEDDEDIFSKAKDFEDFFHNGSSGIDTFTSASGGLCSASNGYFQRLPDSLLDKLDGICFSIIDTRQPRLVKDVKSSIDKTALSQYIEECQEISNQFTSLLERLDVHQIALCDLVNLFNRAQHGLVRLYVSTRLINSICQELCTQFPHKLGAKITGAGGGGCILLVHDCEISESDIRNEIPNVVDLYYNVKIAR